MPSTLESVRIGIGNICGSSMLDWAAIMKVHPSSYTQCFVVYVKENLVGRKSFVCSLASPRISTSCSGLSRANLMTRTTETLYYTLKAEVVVDDDIISRWYLLLVVVLMRARARLPSEATRANQGKRHARTTRSLLTRPAHAANTSWPAQQGRTQDFRNVFTERHVCSISMILRLRFFLLSGSLGVSELSERLPSIICCVAKK
jgi:hypothetical protein